MTGGIWYLEKKTLLKKNLTSMGKHYQFHSLRGKNAGAFFEVTFKLLSLLHKMPLAKIMLLL